MWLKSFKVALAEHNIDKIDELIQNMPQFDSIDAMNEALYLIKEATAQAKELQQQTLSTKNKLKKSIDFMQSTQREKTSKFDTNN